MKDSTSRSRSQSESEVWLTNESLQAMSQRDFITRRNQQATFSVLDELWDGTDGGRNHGAPTCHGLGDRQPESLMPNRRMNEDVCLHQQGRQVIPKP